MNIQAMTRGILGSSEQYLRKNAPTILTATGVIGFVATNILTARATLSAQYDLDFLHVKCKEIKDRVVDEEVYTKKDQARDIGKAYLYTARELAKKYWLPGAVGAVSIACVVSSHGIQKSRQASLLAAYATLDQGFRAYRRRVEDELGAEKELDFYRGVISRKEVQSIGEDGDKCVINQYGDQIPSPYARFFDETSQSWSRTPEYNLFFLKSQQDHMNDRLRAHGFVFLNEVYEALGLERTQAGQVVGWKLKGDGDGFIDFGLFDIGDECNRAFINGIEHTVLLDFNVDGPIKI